MKSFLPEVFENLKSNPLREVPFDTSNLNSLNLLAPNSMFNLLIFSIALSLKGSKVLLFLERGEAEPIGEAEPFLFPVCVISSVAS